MPDGTQQDQRAPAALQEGWFRVDELRLEDRVAMSAGLASQLTFFDLQHRPAGTWGEMFADDEAMVLARIMSIDIASLQARFLRHFDAAPLEHLATQVITLAGWMDQWFKTLKTGTGTASRALQERLDLLMGRRLGEDMAWIFEHFGIDTNTALGQLLARTRQRLDPAWLAPHPVHAVPPDRPPRERLRSAFFAFLHAIERLQDLAREQLPRSLQSEAHEPAAGLFLTFLQLFEGAQRHLNRFTTRHVDFYYDECLRLQPRAAEADTAHLVCARDATQDRTQQDRSPARDVVIPRGTRFLAGKDAAGDPVEFEAEERLLVTDAQVVDLRTLRLERDTLISPEREFDYVTRAKSRQLPAGTGNPEPKGTATAQAWPLFGGTDFSQGAQPAEDARIGLAIASPLLWLKEGEREIRIDLRFEHAEDGDPDVLLLIKRMTHGPTPTLAAAVFKRYLVLDPRLLGEAERSDAAALERLVQDLAEGFALAPSDTDYKAGPPLAARCYRFFIHQLVLRAATRELFYTRLGRLFDRWLLSGRDWLTPAEVAPLKQAARTLLGPGDHERPPDAGDPLCLIRGTAQPEHGLVFDQVFNGVFGVALSVPGGWYEADGAFVVPAPAEPGAAAAAGGVQLVIRLLPEDPPVVACHAPTHGAPWPEGLPLLRLQLKAQARLYPYSLLSDVLLSEVTVAVEVHGVRELALHNQLGRLDASKPFNPFGPLPTPSSYLVFGSPEAARKNLVSLHMLVEWGGLPPGAGGFAAYYEGYEPVDNRSFTATTAILRDGQWQAAGAPIGQPLFADADASGQLSPCKCLVVDEAALAKHQRAVEGGLQEAAAAAALPELTWGPSARNGFFRLQLSGPPMAFGHQAYPTLLTGAVTENARRPKDPVLLPNPPYTPVMERLTLDYVARRSLHLGQVVQREPGSDPGDTDLLLHLHPFGMQEVYPRNAGTAPTVLPLYPQDGHLFIGLSAGSAPQGALALLFHLRDESAGTTLPHLPVTRWSYLADDRWHPLAPERVLSDTTGGFLTSGIVTLDVPGDIARGNTVLPAELYWLCVTTDESVAAFAGLYGVKAQALRVRRVLGADMAAATTEAGLTLLPEGTIKAPVQSIPGLAGVRQVGPSWGLRRREDRQQARTRMGERLRHKQRASTPWDYERLVLERFPGVFKVKCFTGAELGQDGTPGQVRVVVVPAVRRNEPQDSTLGPRMNAIDLQRIGEFLRALASPFARIEVRNAAYERVQVRCTVKLARGVAVGRTVRLLNQAIVEYLSPWHDIGYQARFDWVVRSEDIETRLREIEGVEFVTRLSLLHIAADEHGVYTLGDTARAATIKTIDADTVPGTRLRPKWAWSLALPMRQHLIATAEQYGDPRPEPTGIARLAIGSTFIVGGSAVNGSAP